VALFFVLSGYVIAYVTSEREKSAVSYLISRVSRLYSVVLIALPLTFVCDYLGQAINPTLYTSPRVLMHPPSLEGYVTSFFFLNEYHGLGIGGNCPGTNGPWWSLSFEATYYLAAVLFLFLPRRIGIGLSLCLVILAGNTIAILFPLWLLGFLLYRFSWGKNWPKCLSMILLPASIIAIAAIPAITEHTAPTDRNFGIPFLYGRGPFFRDINQDYAAGFFFTLHLIAARNLISSATTISTRTRKLALLLGAQTFPLYCIHYPLICLWTSITIWSIGSWKNIMAVTLFTSVITLLATPLCDHLKDIFRKSLTRYFNRPRPDRPATGWISA
jgi:peptidoglycan/LPS O-acetylase OafA/YrhL